MAVTVSHSKRQCDQSVNWHGFHATDETYSVIRICVVCQRSTHALLGREPDEHSNLGTHAFDAPGAVDGPDDQRLEW